VTLPLGIALTALLAVVPAPRLFVLTDIGGDNSRLAKLYSDHALTEHPGPQSHKHSK